MKFNEKIVKLRKLKGLTQDEFASAVGVSRQAVYKWESGQSYPEVPKLLEMKILFGISLDDLLDENFEVVLPEKTKKRRKTIEKKVEEETKPVIEETVSVEAPIEESIDKEEALVAAVAEEKEEAAPAPSIKEEVEEIPEKKKSGFFGRLFGRK